MENVFLKLLNMSITASWLVLAVVMLRFLLKKAPKAVNTVMWAFVGVRLICPFSFESVLSLIPSSETVPSDIIYSHSPAIHSGIPAVNSTINPVISESFAPDASASVNPLQIITGIATVIWIIGIIGMLIYAVVSYVRLHKKVREGVVLKDNIWLCDRIETPFILGLFRPRIFLPSSMNEADMEYVIAHEKAHLKRLDHIWKPLGFLLLTVYWFNPVLWLAYILLCRDIELACDEKVIKEMGTEIKKPYSEALINCSVSRRTVSACPLAFGETGVKSRIKSVLNYKKPAFRVIVVAVITCIAVTVCFLTDPTDSQSDDFMENIIVTGSGSENDIVTGELISAVIWGDKTYLEIKWTNHLDRDLVTGEEFYLYQFTYGDYVDTRLRPDLYAWEDVGYIIPANGSFTKKYSLEDMMINEPAELHFEASFNIIDGSQNLTMWLDFKFGETDFYYNDQYFNATELVYADGSYSFVQSAENFPEYQVKGITLFERYGKNQWLNLGILEKITLNEETFDSRFLGEDDDIQKLKRENVKAWELKISRNEINELFLLLKQKNGDYYMAYGYYAQKGLKNPKNEDLSTIRWVYKMVHIVEDATETMPENTNHESTTANSTSQTTVGGVDEPVDVSFLDYTKAIELVKEKPDILAIHCPYSDENADSLILVGEAYGSNAAEYLENANWRRSTAPLDELSSPGSVEFVIEEDYRITVHKRKSGSLFAYAVVKVNNEERYYHASYDDYEKAVAILHTPEKINIDAGGYNSYSYITDNDSAYISMDPENKSVFFSLSLLSSYVCYGTYTEDDDHIVITSDDIKNQYTFRKNGGNLIFEADKSTKVPEYRYSQDATQALPCIPDGAVFESHGYQKTYIDKVYADIDNDGIKEDCIMGNGPTSGLFTVTFTVYEEGKLEYFNIFNSFVNSLCFDTQSDGNVIVKGKTFSVRGEKSTDVYFDISIKDGNVVLSSEDEAMAYWGEQGINSPYAPAL